MTKTQFREWLAATVIALGVLWIAYTTAHAGSMLTPGIGVAMLILGVRFAIDVAREGR
jgi:hypothetical protein